RRGRVTTKDGVEPAGGHGAQVNLILVIAEDCDLTARRAQDKPLRIHSKLPARHGQHEGGAVELAVDVPPFPVAVLLRRSFEGAASGIAVLKLQGGGRGGDVRPVALPAFGFLVSLSLV